MRANNDSTFFVEELEKKDAEIERLKKKLEAKAEKCRYYKEELVNISVLDRWKIGKYLHDNLAQKLTFLKILMRFIKQKVVDSGDEIPVELDQALQIIDEGAREVRDLSHDIIPVSVEKEGIDEAFKYLKDQVETRHNVTCRLIGKQTLDRIKSREVATNLYHIAQEAIKNAINHGEAGNIEIYATEHNDQLHLHIKNDGKPFHYSDENVGMGITIMEHRMEEMGGKFGIRTAKDEDYTTCVVCILSLSKIGNKQ